MTRFQGLVAVLGLAVLAVVRAQWAADLCGPEHAVTTSDTTAVWYSTFEDATADSDEACQEAVKSAGGMCSSFGERFCYSLGSCSREKDATHAEQVNNNFTVTRICDATGTPSPLGGAVKKAELEFQSEMQARAQFEDFMFDFEDIELESKHGNLRPSFIDQHPFLATIPGNGVGQNLVTLEACAVNQPHTHPRGTEVSHIVKGPIRFGFAEENGGRFFDMEIPQGKTIVIPQGLMHYAINPSCEQVQFLASFPSRDPGVMTFSSQLAGIPDDVLRGTLGTDDKGVSSFKAAVEANVNPGADSECLKKCGLPVDEVVGLEGGADPAGGVAMSTCTPALSGLAALASFYLL